MAVTRIEEGGLGTDSFNLPVTLNGTDGSSTDAGDNIVLDASASGVDAGERLLYEGIPPAPTIELTSITTSSISPSSADGATIGTSSAEWSDLYLADGGVVYFGNDQEVTLTHNADKGLLLKHTATADDKPVSLVLQTGETDMAANDIIGSIEWQAPDEGTGTDAILVSAAIKAYAEGDHSSSSNATTLGFYTGASEAAAIKMTLSSAGTLETTGRQIAGGDTSAGDKAAMGYTASEGLILTGQGSTDDITIKNDADTTVVNVATGASDVEISAGNILFGTGSKGVYLGVTSATAANLLDDYEEGTYTASVTATTSGTYTLDSTDTIAYTKIGRTVTVAGYINVASESSPSGNVTISLPFATLNLTDLANSGYHRGATITNHADGTASSNVLGWIDSSEGAKCMFYEETHGTGAIAQIQHDHVDSAFSISLMFSYFAS